MLCELELNGVNPNEVTDEELKNFLSSRAGLILRKGDATLISIFKELAYDMKIADAADRVADFWSQWYAIRKKYNVSEEFNTERGRAVFRKQMSDRLLPVFVKERVQSAEAEAIRIDDKKFFDYVREVAEESQRVHGQSSTEKKAFSSYHDYSKGESKFKKRKTNPNRDFVKSSAGQSSRNHTKGFKNSGRYSNARSSVKCFKCAKLGHKVRDCYLIKDPDKVRRILDKHAEEKKRGNAPRLPSLGGTDRLKVKLNSEVEAEAVLDSAASHTFGIEVVDQEECREVSWVARGVSLPIVGSSKGESLAPLQFTYYLNVFEDYYQAHTLYTFMQTTCFFYAWPQPSWASQNSPM
jgi:hypothetical protein